MAQIPLGNFGQVMPNVTQGRVLPTGGEQIGNALSNLATPALQLTNQLKQQEQEQANLQQKEDDYNFALRAAEYSIEMSELQTSNKTKIVNGELTAEQAVLELKEKGAIIAKTYGEKIPMSTQDRFVMLQSQTHASNIPEYQPIYETKRRTDSLATAKLGLDNVYRIENPEQRKATAYSIIDNNPYLSKTEKAAQRIDYDRREDKNLAVKAIETSAFNNNEEALVAIKAEIEKNNNLTPEVQNSLVATTNNEIARIRRAKEQEAKALEQEAKVAYSEAKQILDTGLPISEEQRKEMREAVAGSPKYAQEMEADLFVSDTLQQFKTLTITEQNKFVMKMRTDLNKEGSVDAVRAMKFLGAMESYNSQNAKLANENPMESIQRQTGVSYYAPDRDSIKSGQIDPAQAKKSALAIKDKNKSDPAYSLNYLSKETMDAIKGDYEKGDTNTKAKIITSLNTVGGGDNNVTHAIYSDMFGAKDATMYRAANYYLNSPNRTTKAGAPHILKGLSLIKDGSTDSILPKDKDLQAAFLSTGRYNNLSSQEAKQKFELQKAYYTSRASEVGVSRDGTTGVPNLNKELWAEAGVVVNEGSDISLTYRGSNGSMSETITKPSHLSDKDFKDKLYKSAEEVAIKYGAVKQPRPGSEARPKPKNLLDLIKPTPKDVVDERDAYTNYLRDLRSYQVTETTKAGVYVFKMPNGQLLKGKNGMVIYSNVY